MVGLNANPSRSLSSLVIFDGAPIHPQLTHAWTRRLFLCAGILNMPGVSYSVQW